MHSLTKVCSKCGETKNLSNFYKTNKGYYSSCKQCKLNQQKSKYKVKLTIVRVCECCGKEYRSTNTKFCSKECYNNRKSSKVELTCNICDIKFSRFAGDIKDKYGPQYCSSTCKEKSYELSRVHINCNFCGKDLNIIKSRFDLHKNNYCNKECFLKWYKTRVGELSPKWKGGHFKYDRDYLKNQLIDWRIAVFTRDDYTCQECGKRGGNLNAHHIKRFRDFPEGRLDINNGVTLCVVCHKKYTDLERKQDKENINEDKKAA